MTTTFCTKWRPYQFEYMAFRVKMTFQWIIELILQSYSKKKFKIFLNDGTA